MIVSDLKPLYAFDGDNISLLASVLLAEQTLCQDSEWLPYINCLPSIAENHCTIFWRADELEMVQPSKLYHDTLSKKTCIKEAFLAHKNVLNHCQNNRDCKVEDFMHAYALVESRAWETSKGPSLIPFADFLNHDGTSESILLCDDNKGVSEVYADRDYSVGEVVFLRYGKFSNATLMLDFGFTLPHNVYDQVDIWMDIPSNDPLHLLKFELLRRHWLPTAKDAYSFSSSGCFYTIMEVKSGTLKRNCLPQALRALARVLSATSVKVLTAMETEAANTDGRLARHPFEDREFEIQAHRILLLRFEHLMQEYKAALQTLEVRKTYSHFGHVSPRAQMATDLLEGELRILRSASSWLSNYCSFVCIE